MIPITHAARDGLEHLARQHHEQEKALEEIEIEGQAIADAVSARERASPTAVQAPRLAVHAAWGGIHEVASGKARLDESTKVGAGARTILDTFFADGVPVVLQNADDTFGTSSRLLERIEDEKLEKTFELVVGKDMLDLARATTTKLGEAIGAHGGKHASMPSSTELQERLARFGRKVARYCRLLAADVNEDDPKSVQRFIDAVKPIDDMRAAARAGGVSADAQPEQPKPAPTTNGAANGGGNDISHA